MNTENIPQPESRWAHPIYGQVEVVACTPRGKPPGRQVKFVYGVGETATAGTAALKKSLKAAKPL